MANVKKVVEIKFKKMSVTAMLPSRVRESDAGYDIFMPVALSAYPGGIFKIPLGFATEIPEGYYASVTSRSSAFAKGLNIVGTIDSEYRGEWHLVIHNVSKETAVTRAGERIAQVIFHKIPEVFIVEVDELAPSTRGDGAFGSTGK